MVASLAAERGLHSCRSQSLERSPSNCAPWGLVAPQHVETSWTRDQTCVPCIGRQIVIHCTAREVYVDFK